MSMLLVEAMPRVARLRRPKVLVRQELATTTETKSHDAKNLTGRGQTCNAQKIYGSGYRMSSLTVLRGVRS